MSIVPCSLLFSGRRFPCRSCWSPFRGCWCAFTLPEFGRLQFFFADALLFRFTAFGRYRPPNGIGFQIPGFLTIHANIGPTYCWKVQVRISVCVLAQCHLPWLGPFFLRHGFLYSFVRMGHRIANSFEDPNSFQETQLVIQFTSFQRICIATDTPKHWLQTKQFMHWKQYKNAYKLESI